MHVLLDPPAPARDEALAAVHRWLGGELRRWRLARLFLGRELADGLGVALAWHLASRSLLSPGREESALRRSRDELLSTLRDAEAVDARSTLGVALAWLMTRFGLSPLALRSRVEALDRDAHVHAFASRAEIRAHQARTAHSEARVYMKILGVDGERAELLGQALASGIERAKSVARAREILKTQGRLVFSAEELFESNVTAKDLTDPAPNPNVARLFGRAVAEARTQLAKGWPLCLELGAWRGRLLAFVLRWHAAELSALEAARGERPAARGGLLRLVACATAALGSRTAPFEDAPRSDQSVR